MSQDNSPIPNQPPYDVDVDYETLQDEGTKQRRLIDVNSGRGDGRKGIANSFTGFNHRMTPAPMAKNRETGGLTFFTRPDFNLSMQNIEQSRRMYEMIQSGPNSAAYSIIAALDPECELTANDATMTKLGSPLLPEIQFDNRQAFIPFLTNNLLTISGFPDSTLDHFASEEGLKREQWIMVDSTYEINYTFSLNLTFRNTDGDPVTMFFTTYLEYMAAVYEGTFIPKARAIIQNELDYQMRVYRVLLDPTGRYVTKIGAALACFPVNDNLGAAMNLNSSNPFVEDSDQINIQFQCVGAAYMDPILIQEFNDLVGMFNPDMLPLTTEGEDFIPYGKDRLRKLSRTELGVANWNGYPRIDPSSKELEWYIYSDDYETIMAEVSS